MRHLTKTPVLLLVVFGLLIMLAVPVLAAVPVGAKVKSIVRGITISEYDPVCVQNAVEKRENAIIVAYDTKVQAIKNALVAKKAALVAAWGKTDQKERVQARQKAWEDFKSAVKTATQSFREAVKNAWKAYREERRACQLKVEAEPVNWEFNNL